MLLAFLILNLVGWWGRMAGSGIWTPKFNVWLFHLIFDSISSEKVVTYFCFKSLAAKPTPSRETLCHEDWTSPTPRQSRTEGKLQLQLSFNEDTSGLHLRIRTASIWILTHKPSEMQRDNLHNPELLIT